MDDKYDVLVPVEMYNKMIVAEQDAARLKQFLGMRFKSYRGISHDDLKALCDVFCIDVQYGENEE